MKLTKKVRVGSKKKRKYDTAQTPFLRLLKSRQISREARKKLISLYQTLNPAALKRAIDQKVYLLYQVYRAKHKGKVIAITTSNKKEVSVRF